MIFLYPLYKNALQPSAGNVSYSQLAETILISHAGGGLDIGSYSNSKESMDQATTNGYKYIEVDISQTQNGEWVLIHDWTKTYLTYFIYFPDFPQYLLNRTKSIPKTAQQFENMDMRYDLTPMSLSSMMEWLKKHPDVRLVTDIKISNYEGLKKMKLMMDGDTHQIIPQIYTPKEYDSVKQLGYEDIILTVYKFSLNLETLTKLSKFADDHQLFALTVPQQWINEDTKQWRPKSSTQLFTHTINNLDVAKRVNRFGVTGIYTDYIIPAAVPEDPS